MASGKPTLLWCQHRFDDRSYSAATLDRLGMRKFCKVIDTGIHARVTHNMRDVVALLDESDRTGVELRFGERYTTCCLGA